MSGGSEIDAADDGEGDYGSVYRRHAPRLFRLALLLAAHDRHLAEDVVSDVFIAAHRPWEEGRIADFGAYGRRAVVNRLRDHGRHRAVAERFLRTKRRDDQEPAETSDELAVDVTERAVLWDALSRLPPGQRRALVLRFYEDLSVNQVATLLGVAPGTVKSQVSDAVRSLRRWLDDPRLGEGEIGDN